VIAEQLDLLGPVPTPDPLTPDKGAPAPSSNEPASRRSRICGATTPSGAICRRLVRTPGPCSQHATPGLDLAEGPRQRPTPCSCSEPVVVNEYGLWCGRCSRPLSEATLRYLAVLARDRLERGAARRLADRRRR